MGYWNVKRTKINQKEVVISPFKKCLSESAVAELAPTILEPLVSISGSLFSIYI